MNKKTLLTLIVAAYPLMTLAEAQQTSVQRINHLSSVMQAQGYEKAPKVADVNALPADVIDVDVNGKQIALAWDLLKAGDDNEAQVKAIQDYAESLAAEAMEAFKKAEKAQADEEALKKEQQEKALNAKKAKSKGKTKGKANNNKSPSHSDDEAHAGNFTHEVSAKGIDRRCRSGQCFTKMPTLINQDDFKADQFKALQADDYLNVVELDNNH